MNLEFNEYMKESLIRVESKLDRVIENQGKFVTHTESHWKTAALATFTLLINGLLRWEDLIAILKP